MLAHPFQVPRLDDNAGLRELIEYCMTPGTAGDGVPATAAMPGAERLLRKPWRRNTVLSETGGSDYHGSNKPRICLGSGIEKQAAMSPMNGWKG